MIRVYRFRRLRIEPWHLEKIHDIIDTVIKAIAIGINLLINIDNVLYTLFMGYIMHKCVCTAIDDNYNEYIVVTDSIFNFTLPKKFRAAVCFQHIGKKQYKAEYSIVKNKLYVKEGNEWRELEKYEVMRR